MDNLTFENTNLVEKFLYYWRTTGLQRVGILYGNYGIHSDVPLGELFFSVSSIFPQIIFLLDFLEKKTEYKKEEYKMNKIEEQHLR